MSALRAEEQRAEVRDAVGQLPCVLYVHGGAFSMMSKDTHRIMAYVLAAQGYQESRLDQSARSHAGAIGIMGAMVASRVGARKVVITDISDYRLGLASGRVLTFEAKLGLVDSPDAKFTVGWSF